MRRLSAAVLPLIAFLWGCAAEQPRAAHRPGEENAEAPPPISQPSNLDPASVPVFGGTLALDPDGAVAWVGDPENDRILEVDLAGKALVAAFDLPEGSLPFRLVVTADHVYASLRGSSSLAVIDPVSGDVDVVPANCPEPRGLAWDDGRDSLWLACASREIIRFDADGTEVARFEWRPDLRDVAVLDDGTIAVSRFRSAEIGLFDDRGNLLDELSPPAVKRTIAGEDAWFQPEVAWRMIADRGALVLLHQRATTSMIRLSKTAPPDPDKSPYGGGDGGGATTCTQITHPALTRFDVAGTGQITTTPPIADDTLAVDVAFDPFGMQWVVADAAALPGDVDTPLVQPDQLGQASDVLTVGCALGPVGSDRVDGAAVAAAVDGWGRTVALGQSPLSISVDGVEVGLGSATPFVDPDTSAAFGVFHQATPSGLACASCHPEGQDDGHVWLFSEPVGARRTQNIAVGIAQTLPLHWDGEFGSVQALLDDVLVNRMGGVSPGSRDGTRLLDWVDDLRPVRTTPEHPELVEAGAQVFQEAGCAACHAGSELTDNQSVDVGTGLLAQVPSLRGVGSRGPWIHTGCAETLEDRFDPACGGTTHAAPLPDDVEALVAYLETL